MPEPARDSIQALAERFVQARLKSEALAHYPGEEPRSLVEAYAVQDAAIALWPDDIAGWKVGLVQPQHRARYGAERIAGPIFRKQIAPATEAVSELPVIPGGFSAAEAELVLVVGKTPPAGKTDWTPEEADAFAGAMHAGLELAGSPFAGINDFGPAVTASDFGNNTGLVVGAEIPDWRARALDLLAASTNIDSAVVGAGSGANIPGGPLAAFAFILGHCAQRGLHLRVGDVVSTGAITGVHQVQVGQNIRVDFGAWGAISCRIVDAAQPSARAASA